jgi:hypothetical protein
MKHAILYICTGKYTIFWEKFYSSCEKYFFHDTEKHYFVFTDGQIPIDNERIHRIEQKNLGWPGNTLYRYHMFWNIREQLAPFDYIFFFNSNCEFLAPVREEFLPSSKQGITVVQHPGFFNKEPDSFTYDRNPKSQAYIPFGKGSCYICGGVNGGYSDSYLELIYTLKNAIEYDDAKGVVALWHDESHINKYILTYPHKLLSPSYCYPEGWDIPFEKIILIRDKSKYGGHNTLRNINEKKKKLHVKLVLKKIFNFIKHYLKYFIPFGLLVLYHIKEYKSKFSLKIIYII